MAMSFTEKLAHAERKNDSLLCVGLDPEPAKFPGAWQHDRARIFDFCATIVDATRDLVIAFKPQMAYFAAHRAEDQLERLMNHIRQVAPEVPVILDAKRGDIGSTAEQYAREAFERYQADAVTLSPFMGFDSIEPYLAYEGKGAILLCRTSNPGGADLQAQRLASGELLYEHIARQAQEVWNRNGQLGLVVGATHPAEIERVRDTRTGPAAAHPRRRRPGRRRRRPPYGAAGVPTRDAPPGRSSSTLRGRCSTRAAATSSLRQPARRARATRAALNQAK